MNSTSASMDLDVLKNHARSVRVEILKMLTEAGSGHTGGSLSAADIATALYFSKMRYKPDSPKWNERDRFVLSKGHAAPLLYVVLALSGYFDKSLLKTLRKVGSPLQGHPCSTMLPGVEVSTGSLGQGLSIANGMAMGIKLNGLKSRVYCLLGDGELQEGQVWEAAMTGSHYGLDNLCAIVDNNGLQIDGHCCDVMSIEPIVDKWRAFGWHVMDIDGHDMGAILAALDEAETVKGKPSVIVARTVKGKGVSFFEGKAKYHGVAPTREELDKALKELSTSPYVSSGTYEGGGQINNSICGHKPAHDGSTCNSVEQVTKTQVAGRSDMATRDAYGEALLELGGKRNDIVVLDADLSGSTKTSKFAKAFPERFFNMGVSEQDMVGTAGGLALAERLPFASTFAIFEAGRAWEQIRQSICYPRLNVKLVATHSGITVGEDGASHQAVEDIALMRVIPNMTVIVPSDGLETRQVIAAITDYIGPVYVRLGRAKVPAVMPEDYRFGIGRAYTFSIGKDVNIIAAGITVAIALEAAAALKKEGVDAGVINMSTIKPLDGEALMKAADACSLIITAEEHSVIGGLGSAVSEFLSERKPVRIIKIGIRDVFGCSGAPSELMKVYGLTSENIVKTAREALK